MHNTPFGCGSGAPRRMPWVNSRLTNRAIAAQPASKDALARSVPVADHNTDEGDCYDDHAAPPLVYPPADRPVPRLPAPQLGSDRPWRGHFPRQPFPAAPPAGRPGRGQARPPSFRRQGAGGGLTCQQDVSFLDRSAGLAWRGGLVAVRRSCGAAAPWLRLGGSSRWQVSGNPVELGAYNSLGTMIPAPELNNRGDALRAEYANAAGHNYIDDRRSSSGGTDEQTRRP